MHYKIQFLLNQQTNTELPPKPAIYTSLIMTSSSKNKTMPENEDVLHSQLPSTIHHRNTFVWTSNQSLFVSIYTLMHARSDESGACWCNDSRKGHQKEAPTLDIRSANYRNRLFKTLNQIWKQRPTQYLNKLKDSVLTITATVNVTFKKDGTAFSVNRSVNVLLTQENIASSSH